MQTQYITTRRSCGVHAFYSINLVARVIVTIGPMGTKGSLRAVHPHLCCTFWPLLGQLYRHMKYRKYMKYRKGIVEWKL